MNLLQSLPPLPIGPVQVQSISLEEEIEDEKAQGHLSLRGFHLAHSPIAPEQVLERSNQSRVVQGHHLAFQDGPAGPECTADLRGDVRQALGHIVEAAGEKTNFILVNVDLDPSPI
jgi:hypothetical protein